MNVKELKKPILFPFSLTPNQLDCSISFNKICFDKIIKSIHWRYLQTMVCEWVCVWMDGWMGVCVRVRFQLVELQNFLIMIKLRLGDTMQKWWEMKDLKYVMNGTNGKWFPNAWRKTKKKTKKKKSLCMFVNNVLLEWNTYKAYTHTQTNMAH